MGVAAAMEEEQLSAQRQTHLGCPIVASYCCPARVVGCKSASLDSHVPKSQATEEHQNNQQVDQVAKIEVAQVDLDRWARDQGLDFTMDIIAQVIHECVT